MMAERTGQGTAWYAGTYTRSQNHSDAAGPGRRSDAWYLAAIFCCAATIR